MALGRALASRTNEEANGAASTSSRPLLRRDLWHLFAEHPLQTYAAEEPPFRTGDLVGPSAGDQEADVTAWRGVRTAEHCRRRCGRRGGCLAWSFDARTRECRASPWVVPGPAPAAAAAAAAAAATGTVASGVNWSVAKAILRECPPVG
ncbi:hypothetical protein E4U41_002527 [Claviceps citrina]|nr:hypothetical protein E4U41_002527 [Claviceps citrina]